MGRPVKAIEPAWMRCPVETRKLSSGCRPIQIPCHCLIPAEKSKRMTRLKDTTHRRPIGWLPTTHSLPDLDLPAGCLVGKGQEYHTGWFVPGPRIPRERLSVDPDLTRRFSQADSQKGFGPLGALRHEAIEAVGRRRPTQRLARRHQHVGVGISRPIQVVEENPATR